VLDDLAPPELAHHDPASPEEESGPASDLRQRREIYGPLMGNAKTPQENRGPVDERMNERAGG
jgi:hypothetical protein